MRRVNRCLTGVVARETLDTQYSENCAVFVSLRQAERDEVRLK